MKHSQQFLLAIGFAFLALEGYAKPMTDSIEDDMSALSNVVNRIVSKAPIDVIDQLSGDFSNLVMRLSIPSRSGWASFQLVSFANGGPETNAVLVSRYGNPSKPNRPTYSWKSRYSDDEVKRGVQRNQIARILILQFCLTSLSDDNETIPYSELFDAVVSIWATDLDEKPWGRGFNPFEFHRTKDNLTNPKPLISLFAISKSVDEVTRDRANRFLQRISEIFNYSDQEDQLQHDQTE